MALQRFIREQLQDLVDKNMQIVPSVASEERQAYEERASIPGHAEATSGEYFRFDVRGTPHSPWNQSAARVFADHVIYTACLTNTVNVFEGLRRGFATHLETIIRRYRKSLMFLRDPEGHKRLVNKARRQTRKYQVTSSVLPETTNAYSCIPALPSPAIYCLGF